MFVEDQSPARLIYLRRHQIPGVGPLMFLQGLFASIRERRHRATREQTEKGAQILRRLQELSDVKNPKPLETPYSKAPSENDPSHAFHEKTGT
jgi:hypothetical protein